MPQSKCKYSACNKYISISKQFVFQKNLPIYLIAHLPQAFENITCNTEVPYRSLKKICNYHMLLFIAYGRDYPPLLLI